MSNCEICKITSACYLEMHQEIKLIDYISLMEYIEAYMQDCSPEFEE